MPRSTFTRWQPASWRPPIVVTPKEMDQAAMMQQRAAGWEEAKDLYHLPASTPLPTFKRWILPEEAGAVWAECMVKAGQPFKAGPYSEVDYAGPDQTGAWIKDPKFNLAIATCSTEYSLDPRTMAPYTPSTAQAIWYYYHDYAIPCLKEFGFAPDLPLPDQSEFVKDPDGWILYPGEPDPKHPLTAQVRTSCSLVPWKVLVNP